jgi:hypothetical protein
MGWTAPEADLDLDMELTARALAEVYGEPRHVKSALSTDALPQDITTVSAPELDVAPEVSTSTCTARDVAAEEAALWADAARFHTEDFDDAYVKERQRRRQESDGRPPPPEKQPVNRAELFNMMAQANATNITHVYYEAPAVNNYDSDKSPQCRVPSKQEGTAPAPASTSTSTSTSNDE